MSQIEELQSRITRALDRIGQGIDNVGSGITDADLEAVRGRAEAAEQELSETQQALAEAQEALAAAREQAEVELNAAVEAVRNEAVAEIERIRQDAQADAKAPEAEPEEGEDAGQLRALLEDEQMANAQLQERLRVLKGRLAEAEAATQLAPTDPPKGDMAELDAELQRLRTANEQLTASNAALREANAHGVGEPELINAAMAAELEALRAARATETAEALAVMGALTPLLADAAEEEAQG
ncbi:hypothetical protein [Antarctobacter jejuensis]|uniref:hypothetical protein n=1 Tax=Antarctobacter jejuensis TaxID=1439938 RepID=UPI003FD053E8